MAFTMACPNFKIGLKMAFGPLGVNTLIAFLLSYSMFSVFEVRECLTRWQSKDLFLPSFQGSIDT
jgi:hypothetical protein